MTTQRSYEIKVGLVSLLAIVLLIVGITLGRNYNVSVSQTQIMLKFPNSGGIQEGAPVVVNGVRRGSVSSIKNHEGSVLITASIDNVADFRSDVSAVISILEITGGKKIDIRPGKSNAPFNKDLVINGITAYDIGDLVALVGEVGDDASVLIKRLDTMSYSLNTVVSNKQFLYDVRTTISNTTDITNRLQTLVAQNQDDINIALQNLKTITSDLKVALHDNKPKVESLIEELNVTLASAKRLIGNADTAITHADNLLFELGSMTRDLKTNGSLASRVLYDKEMGMKLDSTLTDLQEFLSTIKQHGVNVNLRFGTRP